MCENVICLRTAASFEEEKAPAAAEGSRDKERKHRSLQCRTSTMEKQILSLSFSLSAAVEKF